MLQNEDAWPLQVCGIVLDHNGSVQSFDDIEHVNAVTGEFLIAVKRYAYFAACHQRAYFVQRLAQFRDPVIAGVRPVPLTLYETPVPTPVARCPITRELAPAAFRVRRILPDSLIAIKPFPDINCRNSLSRYPHWRPAANRRNSEDIVVPLWRST